MSTPVVLAVLVDNAVVGVPGQRGLLDTTLVSQDLIPCVWTRDDFGDWLNSYIEMPKCDVVIVNSQLWKLE